MIQPLLSMVDPEDRQGSPQVSPLQPEGITRPPAKNLPMVDPSVLRLRLWTGGKVKGVVESCPSAAGLDVVLSWRRTVDCDVGRKLCVGLGRGL